MSITVYFCSLLTVIKTHLLELNCFESGIQDESIIRNERRSTRLYLFIFLLSLFNIGLYYSFIPYTQTILIPSPTFIKYSTLSKEVSLQCPCTKIAVKYDEFVEMKPVYHELCQSDFISDEYIHQLYILYEQTWNRSISTDFHRIATFQFQTLRTLCQLTQKTVKDNLQTFLQKEFVQTQMISTGELEIQMASLVADFIDSTPKTFLRTLKFIQNTTAQSLLMTGASLTSVLPRVKYSPVAGKSFPYSGMIYTFANDSSCTCSSSTATNCMGLSTLKNNIVPGFQTGCYMFNALLNSTLEALYNQTYVNVLTNSSNDYPKLNGSVSNFTIETLLSEMFVTHWSNKTYFERYFNNCAPNLCQYTVTKQHGFLSIIIILIGFFGGLSSALRIIAPFIITTLWPIIWKFLTRRRTSVPQIVETNVNTSSVGDRLRRFFGLIKQKLIELNLFQSVPPSQDENILRKEQYTTRLYLILFILSLIILTVFTSINPQTIRVIVKAPSSEDFIKLHEQYPKTLHCPCSQTTIDHKFIYRIKPEYHEVCSSEFVSSNWINIQFLRSSSTILLTNDIRYQSEFHFQLLSTVCHMANQIIEDSLHSFNQTQFVTNEALSRQSFQTQVDSIVADFKRILPASFQLVIQLIKVNFQINQFITPMNSDFWYDAVDAKGDRYIWLLPFAYRRTEKQDDLINNGISDETDRCTSYSDFECYQNTMINENGINNNITGMVQTWFPFQSLMMSTLECFYYDKCLSQIKQFINTTRSPTNFTTLKSSSSLNNNQYDRIETLANHLFIQSWYNESFYESYFNQCHPLTCEYTYESRFHLIYIVTTIIGFLGGLNVVLRLLLPFIVKLVAKIWNYVLQRQQNNSTTPAIATSIRTRFCDGLRTLLMYSKKTIAELNLFQTIPPSTDPKIMRRNRRTTRIYLILLITALFNLIIYTSLRQETVTINVESPSLSTYKELFVQYPLTLQCPCNHITIKFKEFISQIEPQYHQICSSVFVSQKWLNSMLDLYASVRRSLPELTKIDFRQLIRAQFQTLSTFCKVSRNTLNTSLSVFKENDFITAYLISRAEFDVRTEAVIEQFKQSTSNQFVETFKIIQATNHANQLATVYYSNWVFVPKYPGTFNENRDELRHALTRRQNYGTDDCSCGIQSNCSTPVTLPSLVSVSDRSFMTTLPGFLRGCMMLDSFLQSTLTCLHNETCLNFMRASIYNSQPIPADVLTYSSLSMSNTTIETLLSQVFVSQWFENTSFDRYFNSCEPQSCQYSYVLEYNSLYVITTLIALFGGLTSGLHFVVKYLAIIVYKIVDRRKKKIQIAPDSKQLDMVTIDQDNGTIEVIQSPTTATVQVKMASVEEQRRPEEIRRDRRMLVCLSLLAVAAIVTVFIVLFTTRNKEQQLILTTMQTTVKSSNSIITELTSTSTSICHMTLKYQSQTYPTGLRPVSMVTGDFNHDSIVDLAVINADSDTLSVMLGNNDGTFQTQQIFPTGNGSSPREIAMGDFNNDTFADLVITLSAPHKIVIFFGVASNILFLSPPYTFPYDTSKNRMLMIATGDMDSNGFIDLLVLRQPNMASRDGRLSTCLNRGDGYSFNCIESTKRVFGNMVISIIIGDFNSDGRQNDYGFIDSAGRMETFEIDTSFSFSYSYLSLDDMYKNPSSIIKGRFNDDEIDDLALISSQSDTLQVVIRYKNILKAFTYVPMIYLTDHYPISIARINFNNDLIDDLAILNCNGTVSIFIGTKIGLFDRKYLSFGTSVGCASKCCQSLQITDLNQDGRDDLVFIDTEINSIRVMLGSPCNE